MITTIFKCDRCGHEQTNNVQMWEVMVGFRHLDWSNRPQMAMEPKKLWCRECCEEFAPLLASRKAQQPTDAPKPLALEDLLREMIREEIQAATGVC